MMSNARSRTLVFSVGAVAIVAAAVVASAMFGGAMLAQTKSGPGTPVQFLHWQLPPSGQAYGKIDGAHLKTYVEEIATLTKNNREPGSQYWGRITGLPSDAKMREWVEAKFQKVGLHDVRNVPFDVVDPQWVPTAWSATVTGGAKTLKLSSAHPFTRSKGFAAGGVQVPGVWLGLGTKADFAGRDVRGKAAFIYSHPFPSWHNSSVSDYKAVERARDAGAAAIFVVWGIPGNFEVQAGSVGNVNIPVFSLGKDDGEAVRELLENDPAITVRASLDVKTVPGLKSGTVWGTLPGTTDEEILVMAHRDGFFEGAGDNASGIATMLGIAEYYAKVPQAQRRRTIRFMGSTGHHMTGPHTDVAKLHDDRATALAKTVLILNPEHVGWTETYTFGGTQIIKANSIAPLRWATTGGDRLKALMFNAYAEFGVNTLQEETNAYGDVNPVKNDVPTISLIESPYFWHCSCDTPDVVPATAIEAATRAMAKIIDEVNRLERKDLMKTEPMKSTSGQ
jgi:hypothetical protein